MNKGQRQRNDSSQNQREAREQNLSKYKGCKVIKISKADTDTY